MDEFIKSLDIKKIAEFMIDGDTFIELYNNNEAILLDIRFDFEHEVWNLPFAKNIPLNLLSERLDELPKDTIIVCGCPEAFRSNIACQYLLSKGYNAKVLTIGLLKLMDRLRGGKAKDIKIV